MLVTARGFRTREVRGIRTHTDVTLQRGLRVRLALRNAPRTLENRNVRFLLRIGPTTSW